MTQLLTLQDDLKAAVDTLRRGGVIIYPTDTIWGIGCDATRPEAVSRIYELKRRSDSKALITLMADDRMLERYVDDPPEVALQLMELSEKPVTVIFDHATGLAPNLTAADGSLGVRIPRDDYASALCRMLRRPVVSTSANISGMPAPATFAAIDPVLLDGADYVACHRRTDTEAHVASSIIKITGSGIFKLIRP
ncbi:MAG: L-threonylcarbamoyladenylate synthase [Candidatus Amulumruptor caecigallinarius]|nr:L-threonylcarbamoyladenylate synthase [Candidatus Amulumruptor caecigallinarius]MCM1395997.1 L-threonylcarbamoyladenylate synthase [Candidatus Amulumruptor caecigallinarius]MCM1454567.1 L-threonylcarbamoyladenylate synthase [bacterium]